MIRGEVEVLRDSPWIAAAIGRWGRSRRLALGGMTPPPRLVRSLLEDGLALQRAAWTGTGRPAGLLQVSDLHERDGTALLDLLVDPDHARELRPELAGFLVEAFGALPLRKLGLWACEDELPVPTYLGRTARLAGRLAAHDRRGPHDHADMLVYEIWKEDVA